MENASKALIIAGAILLAILLISLGIMIFNQAQDTVNNSGMSQAEITAFNNKFLKYEGDQPGSVARSAVNEIIATNASESDENKISVVIKKKGNIEADLQATTNPTTNKIDISQTYTIKLYYGDNGKVNYIRFY